MVAEIFGSRWEQMGTYYWIGKLAEEQAASGIGMRNKITAFLTQLPKGISDRIVSLRLPVNDNLYIHFISIYAPT